MGIDTTEGREFEKQDEQAPTSIFIFNETARKQYDIGLDTEITYHMKPAKILGFCEDIHFRPLQYEQMPLAFTVMPNNRERGYPHLYIRTVPGVDIEAVEEHVRECVGRLAPNTYLENIKVRFFYQELGEEYAKEKKTNMLITAFSLISILIALMGVFGLVFFETQYRRREIAVRRVHGAQISQVLGMFVGQYVKMVLIAFLFAAPISCLIMMRWLQTFAYHISLYWWVFLIALAIVLVVTSAIVVARAYRAAKEDPVNALYKE
jgi:putative ABC transport system permease protein